MMKAPKPKTKPKICTGSPACEVCGAATTQGMIQSCPSPIKIKATTVTRSTARPPNIAKRFVSRCSAKSKWKKAGKPVRSQERVNEIFSICQACPHFRDTHCGLCGCPLNTDISEPMANKIALATEGCPDKPPRWEAEN